MVVTCCDKIHPAMQFGIPEKTKSLSKIYSCSDSDGAILGRLLVIVILELAFLLSRLLSIALSLVIQGDIVSARLGRMDSLQELFCQQKGRKQ